MADLADFAADGLCAQTDPEIFFPEANPRPAKRVCLGCDVLDQCRAWAVPQYNLYGVWAATTQEERGEIRAGRAA